MLHCVLLQCRNTPGSYQCICPSGTQFNPGTRVCADIDECKEYGEEACVGGTCVNVIGSYKCECEEGTIVDSTGRYCIGKEFWFLCNSDIAEYYDCKSDIMRKSEIAV